jgi:hypothetical protein
MVQSSCRSLSVGSQATLPESGVSMNTQFLCRFPSHANIMCQDKARRFRALDGLHQVQRELQGLSLYLASHHKRPGQDRNAASKVETHTHGENSIW